MFETIVASLLGIISISMLEKINLSTLNAPVTRRRHESPGLSLPLGKDAPFSRNANFPTTETSRWFPVQVA